MKKIGLIINPIAGMGGRVGLKGTDGQNILEKARELGAIPQSESRTKDALRVLSKLESGITFLTCSGNMGEKAVRECGFSPEIVGSPSKQNTTSEDTKNAAKAMRDAEVDLLLFAGGDGTARDIYSAVGSELTVIGIPTGVKIHSAVFAQNPKRAGELASLYVQGRIQNVREAEVMDIDEEEFRQGNLFAKLYGYLKIPWERKLLQRLKAGSAVSEQYIHEAIAHEVVRNMEKDCCYIVGPGTTPRAVMNKMNLENTLLGVDLVCNKTLVGKDLNEADLLDRIKGQITKLIVTPVGGQGYLFGRGNQQISPEVLKIVGKSNILVISSKHKLNALKGRPLLIDTGDKELDKTLSDYYRIITGYNEAVIYRASL
ncbi:MAG: ATP-NAD kinase family protein [Candidatus Aminicenantes bacterium]|nr:ATP-NAD kinase family protein [Candidatus Aminicenantes bacterium]